MKPIETIAAMHNAVASVTTAYGAMLEDVAAELAATKALGNEHKKTADELRKMLEVASKRIEKLEADLLEARAPTKEGPREAAEG